MERPRRVSADGCEVVVQNSQGATTSEGQEGGGLAGRIPKLAVCDMGFVTILSLSFCAGRALTVSKGQASSAAFPLHSCAMCACDEGRGLDKQGGRVRVRQNKQS